MSGHERARYMATLAALVLALVAIVVLGSLRAVSEDNTVRLGGMLVAALVALARRGPPPPAVTAIAALAAGELATMGGIFDG